MIVAEAGATAIGMATGFALTLVYLWRRFAAGPPIASELRVGAAVASATLVGRVAPSGGKILGLATLGAVGAVYLVTLLVLREFGPEDRAKFRKILRR